LSDVAKFLTIWSVARSLCVTLASCIHQSALSNTAFTESLSTIQLHIKATWY